ncbi:MAG: DNA-binding protein [Clostridia bacterium]|nr:DNA-binding protein [Clostridia bacterium]
MLLSPKQAADKLGVCTTTILRYIKDGKIKVSRLSKQTIRIDENDLMAFITGEAKAS